MCSFSTDVQVIAGHKSAVLDFDFNPFHEHIIATASDDTTVKVCTAPTSYDPDCRWS